MTTFKFKEFPGAPDRAFVEVDGKYQVAVIRTDEGLVVDVYPKDWDAPIDTMTVFDSDVADAESDGEEAA